MILLLYLLGVWSVIATCGWALAVSQARAAARRAAELQLWLERIAESDAMLVAVARGLCGCKEDK